MAIPAMLVGIYYFYCSVLVVPSNSYKTCEMSCYTNVMSNSNQSGRIVSSSHSMMLVVWCVVKDNAVVLLPRRFVVVRYFV